MEDKFGYSNSDEKKETDARDVQENSSADNEENSREVTDKKESESNQESTTAGTYHSGPSGMYHSGPTGSGSTGGSYGSYGSSSTGSSYGSYGSGSAGSSYGSSSTEGGYGSSYGSSSTGGVYGSYGSSSTGSSYGADTSEQRNSCQSGSYQSSTGQYEYHRTYGNAPQGTSDGNSEQNSGRRHPDKKRKKIGKKATKVLTAAGIAVLFGLVASATFLTSNYIGNKLLGMNQTDTKATAKTTTPAGSASLTKTSSVITSDVSSIVEEVMPSVVSITNMSVQQVQSFFGGISERTVESAGTGIIISQTDAELLIVTNYHVIENCETLTVTFTDETSVEANVKGTNSEHDLAVIAVELDSISDETMDNIAIATLGDSTALKVGEPAIAIGNALGYGQSVTTGVISALNRESLTTDETTGETVSSGVKLIQTDAAINPGNSGGALLNAAGEVIGINSAKLSGTTSSGASIEGMGYAIPISDVTDILDDLMSQETKKKVSEESRGYLGITGFDVTTESSQRFHMPVGVYVDEVQEGSGAEAAGITRGNIITGINGTSIEGMEQLKDELEYYAVGDTVTITIQIPENNGEYTEKLVDVTLGEASK